MSGHSGYQPSGALGRFIHSLEESAIALILGLMALITFVNVVLRYGFRESIIWGQEVTLILFAWLVLLGISYGFKVTAHLGVDAVINIVPKRSQRIMALISAACCLAYALLLLKGAWDYWAPFAALDATTGRWFPSGFADSRNNSFYITDQVPMFEFLRWLEPITLNLGYPESEWEHWEKMPRLIPYFILPFSTALILLRVIQATVAIVQGRQDSLIVSHEAEDAVEQVREKEWEE